MFESEEDKFLYLVGCALNGTAATTADISKITKQAYGIAEEMLSLINKLKPSEDCASTVSDGASKEKLGGKASIDFKDSKNLRDSKDSEDSKDSKNSEDSKDSEDFKDLKLRDGKDVTGDLPGKAPEPVKPIKSPVLPAFINKAANLHSGASAAAREALLLKEPIKLDDLASHDKGWNYTPWGKS